ncbi:RNA polymerase sigma factor [Haliangium ochraceum]|uniref:RNA polymerase, sigma-24 subunit, ECF subfamily n=1 Tax=Haliangium ochraceum (strain DSM 14365 / JCM 11303 / SMP-2) TaxID=502025 RepID=D0LWQ9_HALO1|nr:sigma-70 family RNA polymerase sigma factor [Haliangium ochraceum]ACY14156.1 RNA polymerase, sigma-24 subunit, ECF subfamily [Haliangium ochraceum DSM 14365]
MAITTEDYYRRYGPMVMRRCRQLLGDEEAARDAMQDVFVKLLVREQQLDDRAPSSLLYRIATNHCLNQIRTRARRPESPEAELLERIAHAVDAVSRSRARLSLARLFRDQSESTRTIAVLHLHDGMTLEEVAGEVGLSVSGVRKRLRKLRAHLEAQESPSP